MVSVVIPVYNGEKYIAEAINSVLHQTYCDIEIIVIDDGSTDSTPSIVKSYDKVNYIYQNNSGPSSARNKGMIASSGEYIAFLDCDDLYNEKKIEEQVKILEQNKDVDIVYNDCIMVDRNLNYINTLRSECICENEKDFLCMLLFRQIIPMPPSIMLRRKCFQDGFLYNTGYKHAEDYEFIIRLAERYRFKYLPEPLYVYRRHENNLTNSHNIQQKREQDVLRDLGMEKIQEIVEKSSFSIIEKQFMLAKIYMKLDEYGLARDILINLTKEGYDSAYLWFYLGNCCYLLGKPEEAAKAFNKAVLADTELSEAYNNLACTYSDKDRHKAMELLRKAISLRPDYMDAKYNLKQIETGQHNYKITLRELRKVLTCYMNL